MTHVREVQRGLALGGTEVLMLQHLEHRARHGPAGEERSVLSTAAHRDDLNRRVAAAVDGRLEVLDANSPLATLRATWRDAARRAPGDVVVVHSPSASIGYKLHRAITRRRAYRLVDVVHITRYRRAYVLAGLALNRQADHCICVSSEVSRATSTAGYPSKSVLLGGIDLAAMRAWKQDHPRWWREARSELGIGAGGRLVVNVANLHRRKRQDLLVRSMAHVPPDVHLLIVGDGPLRHHLDLLVRRLGLGDRVHLAGSRPEAWRWTAAADLMVQPSRHEGFPVSLMEALAAGTPTLAARFGGLSDVAGVGDGADLVTLTSARTSRALATDVRAALPDTGLTEEGWAGRLSRASYWDVARYTEEFYAVATGVTGPRTPPGRDPSARRAARRRDAAGC